MNAPLVDSSHGLPPRFYRHRVIAEGGMAYVSLVYDRLARDWRALKTLKPEFAARQSVVTRFEHEGRTMMRIEHPNVIRVHDTVVAEGNVHLVMEYAEAGSVVEWLERHGPMPERLAVDVVLQVCGGIQAAHDDEIIHRDIKPHNLVIDRRGVVKVTDFGIARAAFLPSQTQTGSGMGTLGFMAPEQHASAKTVDGRADIYSIAVTLFTLLKAKPPAHLFRVRESEYAGIHPLLATVIRKGGEYEPEDRYRNVHEMVQALQRALRYLPSDPPRAPLVPPNLELVSNLPPPRSSDPGPIALAPEVYAPTLPPSRSALSFPSRESFAPPPRAFFDQRSKQELARRREHRQKLLVAALAFVVTALATLLGLGLIGDFYLDQHAGRIEALALKRHDTIAEHFRFLRGALPPVRNVDPEEVNVILTTLDRLANEPSVGGAQRTRRDLDVNRAIGALDRLARRLDETQNVGAIRRVEEAAKDLRQQTADYEWEVASCAETAASWTGWVATRLPFLDARCVAP